MIFSGLRRILEPAFDPCTHFSGTCKDYCRWSPENGHVPRGFVGAKSTPDLVRLVVVTAEPGNPSDGEEYKGGPDEMLLHHLELHEHFLTNDSLRRNGRGAPFHRNLKIVLGLCWPDHSLEKQLEYTWITASVLCSPWKSGATIPHKIESTCARTYLKKQIDLFPNAFVLALGVDAQQRLDRGGIRVDGIADHPSARDGTRARQSWEIASKQFHSWLKGNSLAPSISAMSSMKRALRVRAYGTWNPVDAFDHVILDSSDRHRRRLVLTGEKGTRFLLDLPRPTALHDGDGLVLDDGSIVRVAGKPEALIEIASDSAHGLARLAWHLGNRHTDVQVMGETLRIRRDHVLEDMLRRLGAQLMPVEAPFDPEPGAYHGDPTDNDV